MNLFSKASQKVKDVRATIAFLIVCVALVLSGWWAYTKFMTSPPFVDPERYPVRGIDVSRHNGMMNLDAAAADGIDFIFIKASEGESLRDPNFNINFDKARHAGMKTGAYHFFRFDRDGVPQARNFLKAIGSRKPDLDLVIDVEEAGNKKVNRDVVTERLRAMTEYLNLSGYRVIYYSNRDGYYDFIRDAFPGAQLWICSFSRIPLEEEWTFWQFDHHGRVAGIRGDVDLNTFVGSRSDWENYLNGKSPND